MRNWIKKIKEKISEKKIDSSTEPENFSEKNINERIIVFKIIKVPTILYGFRY